MIPNSALVKDDTLIDAALNLISDRMSSIDYRLEERIGRLELLFSATIKDDQECRDRILALERSELKKTKGFYLKFGAVMSIVSVSVSAVTQIILKLFF